MEEELQDKPAKSLGYYWEILCHRRWVIGGAALLVWLLAMEATWILPPKYRSQALILAEPQRVPAQLVPPNVSIDPQDYLQSLSQQIFNRARLLRLMDEHHLYTNVSDPDVRVSCMRKDIALETVKPAEGSGKPEMTAFTMSYSADRPRLAQQVAEQLTSFLIQDSLQNQQQLSETTTEFLQNQMKQAAKDLADQEVQVKEFRSRHLGELPEQLQSNLQILAGLQSQLQASSDGLNRADQQEVYLTSLIEHYKAAGVRAVGAAPPNSAAAPLTVDEQLDVLREQLANASTHYTPNHPDVLRLKRQMAALEKGKQQLDQQPKSGKASSAVTAIDVHAMPILQLQSQLRATELEISSRKTEVANLESKIHSYQERLNQTPVREQELAAITRSYDQARTNYQSLLAKAQQSELATNLQRQQQGDQFRVLDPPSLPLRQYFPNRLVFCLGGLGAGLVVGAAIILGREAIDPRIYREEDVAEATPIAVLSTVPPLPTAEEKYALSRLRRFEWIAASVIVVAVSLVTLVTFLRG